jgi:hypothetical protein
MSGEYDPKQVGRVNRLMALDGATLDVIVANDYGEKVNAGGRTISEEAFFDLRDEMATWVGTRIQRRMQAKQRTSRVKVTVTVEFPS